MNISITPVSYTHLSRQPLQIWKVNGEARVDEKRVGKDSVVVEGILDINILYQSCLLYTSITIKNSTTGEKPAVTGPFNKIQAISFEDSKNVTVSGDTVTFNSKDS